MSLIKKVWQVPLRHVSLQLYQLRMYDMEFKVKKLDNFCYHQQECNKLNWSIGDPTL